MIRAYVQSYDGAGNTEQYYFDAEPWFERAPMSKLKRLAGEKQQSAYHTKPYFYYSGVQTDDVWSSLMPSFEDDPKYQEFMKWSDENDCSWQVEIIDAEQAEAAINKRKTQAIAAKAVNHLLGENDDELIHDVVHSAMPDYKVQAAFDQAIASGRIKMTAWQDALKALGYHPQFVAEMGSLIASYVSFAWAHNSALAYEHVQDKLKKALLPQSHIQALLRLFAREISTYRKTESEGDDMLRDVAMAGANPPWLIAKQAWDQEVRFGYGESPWAVALGALGYMDDTARDVANSIDMLMASAADPGRDGDQAYFEDEWWLAWNDVEAELSRLNMPPSHVEAMKRIWRTHGPNNEMWESEDDDILASVVAASLNPAHALVDAIKNGTALVRTQPSTSSYTWDLTVEVRRPDIIQSVPNAARMVIVRAQQYIEEVGAWSTTRKKIGGYFWVKPEDAEAMLEPLTKLFSAAKSATLWTGKMDGAYQDVIAHRYQPPRKTMKSGRLKPDTYSSGIYKYYG